MGGDKSGAGYGNHAGDKGFAGQDGRKSSDHKAGGDTTGPEQEVRKQPESRPSEKSNG